MTDTATVDRDYAQEARAIIDEAGLLRVPERAHLLALDAQLKAMNRNIVTLGELLLCILADRQEPAMAIPARLLARVRKSHTMPLIHAQPDGSIVVKVIPMGPTPGNGSRPS